jgi:hypothetical protein
MTVTVTGSRVTPSPSANNHHPRHERGDREGLGSVEEKESGIKDELKHPKKDPESKSEDYIIFRHSSD